MRAGIAAVLFLVASGLGALAASPDRPLPKPVESLLTQLGYYRGSSPEHGEEALSRAYTMWLFHHDLAAGTPVTPAIIDSMRADVAAGQFYGGILPPGPAGAIASENGGPPAKAEAPAAAAGADAEIKLLETVATYRAAYPDAANEMAQGGLRNRRAEQLCAIFGASLATKREIPIRGWTGTVDALSSNNSGKAILTVRLDGHVSVSTWSNAVADMFDHTLIEESSALFPVASALKLGDRVRFDGNLIRSVQDCLHESSLIWANSMAEPQFILRFSNLTPY